MTRDLPIYGQADIQKLKAAKASLSFSDLLKPVIATVSTNARILAWGVEPHWLSDYAYVTDETSLDGLTAALGWVLTDEENPRATTVLSTLQKILGEDLRELDSVDMLAEKKSRVKFSEALKLHEPGDSRDR